MSDATPSPGKSLKFKKLNTIGYDFSRSPKAKIEEKPFKFNSFGEMMIDLNTKVDGFEKRLKGAKQELETIKSLRLRQENESQAKINELRDSLNSVTNMLNLKTSEFKQLQREFKEFEQRMEDKLNNLKPAPLPSV